MEQNSEEVDALARGLAIIKSYQNEDKSYPEDIEALLVEAACFEHDSREEYQAHIAALYLAAVRNERP